MDGEEWSMFGRRRWMMAIATLGASAFFLSACSNSNKSDASSTAGPGKDPSVPVASEPWKVGAYLSLSGAETQFGIETKEGIELAVDEINNKGGVKGRQVKVLYEDDKSNPQETNNKV